MAFFFGNKNAGVDKDVIDNLRDFEIKGGDVCYKRYKVHLSILAQTGFESEANRCFLELIKRKKKLQHTDNQAYVPTSAFHHGSDNELENQQFTPSTISPRVIERQTEMEFVRHMQDKLIECFHSRQRIDNLDDLTREIKRQFNTLKKAPRERSTTKDWQGTYSLEADHYDPNVRKIKELEENVSQLKYKYETRERTRHHALSDEKKTLQMRVEELEYQVEEKEKEANTTLLSKPNQDELKAQNDTLKQEILRIENEVQDLNRLIQRCIQEGQNSKQQLVALVKDNSKLKRQRQGWKTKCETLEDQVAKRDEHKANLEVDIENYREAEHSEIAKLRTQNATLQRDRDEAHTNITTELQKKDSAIAALKHNLQIAEERTTDLTNQNSSLTRKIEQLEGDVEHHKITSVTGTSKLQNQNSRLRKERDEHRELHRNAAGMLEDAKLVLTKRDATVSNLERENVSFQREIAALKHDLQNAEERTTNLNNQKSSLTRKIEKLEGDVEHNKITGVSETSTLQNENVKLRKERYQHQELHQNSVCMLEDAKLELRRKEEKITGLQRELKSTEESLTNENDRLKTDISSWENAHASLKNENDQLRTEINSWKNAHAREINANKIKTMQLHDTIRSLQEEKAALNNGLAAEMNARIPAIETTFENISIKARPLYVAQAYELLFLNAWLDAKMALDEHSALDSETQDEEWKVIMLLKMFQVSYTKASEVYEYTKTQAQYLLHYPGTPMKGEQHGLKKSVLTQKSLTFLSDHFRKHSDTHNLDGLIENVSSQLTRGEKALVDICLEVDDVKEYLAQCTRIAWKMVLQCPPMTLSTPGIGCSWKKNDGLELVLGSCPDNPGAKVRYYKQPQLYHGDRLMAKGHVFVK